MTVVVSAAEEKLVEKLSEDAKNKMDIATATLMAINNDLADGSIKISLLKEILEKRETYLDLLKIGNNHCRGLTDFPFRLWCV